MRTVRAAVLCNSRALKRKYSYSALSSAVSNNVNLQNKSKLSQLKQLMKERLVVSRLGFPDKAMEIDELIQQTRAALVAEREAQEKEIVDKKLALLRTAQQRKVRMFEMRLQKEREELKVTFEQDRQYLEAKHEKEFRQLLEDATRRAIGRSKSCSCTKSYLCRHNRTASYNTRRPTKEVVQFKRNAKRLKRGGRTEESKGWEEKAQELDMENYEKWRLHVAESVVASPWMGGASALQQLTKKHELEHSNLQTTCDLKWRFMERNHDRVRRNLKNSLQAEERKLGIQCRKQAILRYKRDFAKEAKEKKKAKKYNSDGLQNISGTLLQAMKQDSDSEDSGIDYARVGKNADNYTGETDWKPPDAAGLDNSISLVEAAQRVAGQASGLVMTSRSQMKKGKSIQDQVLEKEKELGLEVSKKGETSGSRFMDILRVGGGVGNKVSVNASIKQDEDFLKKQGLSSAETAGQSAQPANASSQPGGWHPSNAPGAMSPAP
eukprot:scaffold726_cov262-Pinguiococcus_pyrenoidosus.AAC.27